MPIKRPILSPTRLLTLATLVVATCLLIAPARPQAFSPEESVQGAWVSPDWFFQEDRPYKEAEVRQKIRPVMRLLKRDGINTVFVESIMRGSSIGTAEGAPLPLTPRLSWTFGRRGTRTIDTLQIFIDEAAEQGLQVHAWVHLFYWRMDNDGLYPRWQQGPSIWDSLLGSWLEQQAEALRLQPSSASLVKATREVARTLKTGLDSDEMSQILADHGYVGQRHPLSRLVCELMKAGRPAPDFLLVGSPEVPFPPHPGRTLRPIYLDPGHPEVQRRTLQAIEALSRSHPDLAGLHLDHVRYPLEAQGVPRDLEPRGRENVYFNDASPQQVERRARFEQLVAGRRKTLADFVGQVRPRLHRGQRLSAAVLPLYYVERGMGTARVNGYDLSAQDWSAWDVDMVVPMMYGFDPWRIRTLVKRYQKEAEAARGSRAATVVPGVSKLKMARAGLLGREQWVFFDLTLGLDVRYWKEQEEDMNWTPRRDL